MLKERIQSPFIIAGDSARYKFISEFHFEEGQVLIAFLDCRTFEVRLVHVGVYSNGPQITKE